MQLSWVVLSSAAWAQPQLPRVSLVLTRTGTVSPINDSLTETGVVTVTATMNKAATDTVTVTLSVAPANEFTTTDDYVVSENKVLTFGPGSTVSTGTVTVTSVDDGGVKRHARLIRITFTASSNARTAPNGTPSSFEEFSVVDDELHPTKSVVLTPTPISENGGVATVTAKLSHPTLFGDVQLVVQAGLFPAGTPRRAEASDFTLSDNVRLVIPAGETASTGTVTVTAVDNDVYGPAQKRLASGVYNIARQTVSTEPGLVSNWAILTIEEDDPEPPTLSVDATPASPPTTAGCPAPPETSRRPGPRRRSWRPCPCRASDRPPPSGNVGDGRGGGPGRRDRDLLAGLGRRGALRGRVGGRGGALRGAGRGLRDGTESV